MNTNKTVAAATTVNTPNSEVVKPELSKVMVPAPKAAEKVKEELPPIELRMQKLKELNQLQEKRDRIITAQKNVEGFSLDSTSEDFYLKFSDGNGTSFKITHTNVIDELVTDIKGRLKLELEKIDKQFNFSM